MVRQGDVMRRNRRARPLVQVRSAFTGFGFPPEVILLAVRWYLRYGLSYRDPEEFLAERAAALANVTRDLMPAAFHDTGQYESNRCEADHGRLKARLRPMRGRKTDRTASVVIRGRAFVRNVRCGHCELGVEASPVFWLAAAFDELQLAI